MASYNVKPINDGKPGIAVVAKRGESFEGLMRRFKRSVSKNGIMKMFNQNDFMKNLVNGENERKQNQ